MKVSSRKELKELFLLEAGNMGLHVDVFSDGPVNAEVVLIGEGPGESECRQGLPFVGGAGKVLFDEGRKYEISRTTCYVTNVVKRQISLSSKTDARHSVGRPELAKWISLIRWEIAQLPNVRFICLMGNYALEAFTSNTGITNWRGSVLDGEIDGKKIKFIITFNPAYVYGNLNGNLSLRWICTN